ncbi:MAG: acyl-CoA synthetase [Deltaproteobacteria bacterium]|nr:acyl-CoA synthetase [Deltaproteobacteria bacterium]
MKTDSVMLDCFTETARYGNIFSPPRDLSREFVLNCCTYETVYRRAAAICRLQPSSGESRAAICLCTDDKALLAAALIASLAGGPRLVVPYAFSRQAIEEVLEIMPLSFLLTDCPGDFPSGPDVITPPMLVGDSLMSDAVLDLDNPFLMLFTGGSTGKPKVWAKTPRNMLAEALHLSKKFGISPNDLFLSTVPPMHIYGLLYSVLIPFICRARVLDGVYAFPREILRAARDYRASVLVSVPVHYRVLKVDDLERRDLRMAFSSAGALDKEDAAYFHAKTGLDITEIYGSTETGGVAVRHRSQDGESWNPLETVDWKIQEGILHVRSAFISPTLSLDSDGFFATADRADSDGDRRFILQGRADDIVKVAGKRVDLAAVQAKLKEIPGVRDAVVISLPTGNGRQNEIAALVVTHLDVSHVRRQIAAVSESYAVPRRIAVVEGIPIASTGKYDHSEIERILRG